MRSAAEAHAAPLSPVFKQSRPTLTIPGSVNGPIPLEPTSLVGRERGEEANSSGLAASVHSLARRR